MPSTYLAIRDGGKTDEEGANRLITKLASSQNSGVVGSASLAVSQHGTPNMSVDIAIGDVVIPYLAYLYHSWVPVALNKAVTTSDPSNPRIDRVVAYVDRSVVASGTANNPDAMIVAVIAGTAAGSPVRPNDAAVQAVIGVGNPFVDLADVRVEAAVTTIVNAKITDKRTQFLLGSAPKFGFFFSGAPAVANDLSWNPTVVQAQVLQGMRVYARTAPVGADLIVRLYNITQGVSVGTITLPASSNSASTTSLSNATLAVGDVLRGDITQQGSGTPAGFITLVAY